MRRIALLLFPIFVATATLAQKITLKGRIVDTTINSGLAYTTISLLQQHDSVLVTFTRADSLGNFKLNSIDKGKYLLSASYVGYVPLWKAIEVTGTNTIDDIGNINMTDVRFADSVSVLAKRPPVEINNDTLEFNTENFKTQSNAVVEDMLKKMPGITVDNDGTVKVNGQTVRRVLVNGKEFFGGDVKMATKNLPADAVDKVQVFDKKSDQGEFTGIDDGNSEKTINLKLKKDRNHALFGKVTAGAGTHERYDVQTNINKFKGDEQLSFLGMANNTNRQGFSLMDVLNFTGELSRGMRNGGGITIRTSDRDDDNNGLPITGLGQNQQGVATTAAGGVNYNNTWNKGKTDLSTNYTASNIDLFTDKESSTQNLLPGNSYNSEDNSNTTQEATQHRFNFILDQKIDSSLSFKLLPSLTWQQTKKMGVTNYSSETPEKVKLNDGFSNTSSDADAFNFNSEFLLRKRFRKKGRTISADLNMTYNHSDLVGTQLSENSFYDNMGNISDSNINHHNTRDAITQKFGSNITYTEPLGKRSLLAFSGFYSVNAGQSTKQTYDYNNASGKHDIFDSALSNDFKSNYSYTGGGISFRSNIKKISITTGASLQAAVLKTINQSYHQNISRSFTDLLPNAVFQYQLTKLKNIRIEYNTYTTQPSVMQLQPVADISDPLNITTGNPDLKRAYNQDVQINYFGASPASRKNLFAFVNFSSITNAIVQSDTVKANGSRISTPVNANGVQNMFANLEYGFPLKKLKSRIEAGSSFSYGRNISFINGDRNNISNTAFGPNISYYFSIDNKIELELNTRILFNAAKYSLQPELNNHYTRQNYGIDMTNYLPWSLSLHNEFNYILYTGRSDGYNTNIPLWNVSLAKAFMKNKRAEVKFSAYDLLNRNTGVTRTANQNYITDEKYNVLQRYFLLSFTFSLNKSGLNGGGPRAVIKTFNN